MKNIELTHSECIRIIDALEDKRDEIEKSIKFWSDKTDSNVEKKSKYEKFVRNRSKQLDEVNQIVDKLYQHIE